MNFGSDFFGGKDYWMVEVNGGKEQVFPFGMVQLGVTDMFYI